MIILGLGISFVAGAFVGSEKPNLLTQARAQLANAETAKPEVVDFGPFWKAWALLDQKFVRSTGTSSISTTTEQEKVWGAISGLTDSLGDPYTIFLPPEKKVRFDEDINGNFSGVGMEIGIKGGLITVIAPLPNSPAQKAGILAGDKILAIDGTSTEKMSTDEGVKYIRGPIGTKVILTIAREKIPSPLKIEITRANIEIPTLETKYLSDKNIFIITLYNFSQPSPARFKQAIEEFLRTPSQKLILDLRGNPGGFLDAAVDISSWFLPQGKIIVKEERGKKQDEYLYRSVGYNVFQKLGRPLKMIILIDRGSASASEIVAGALSEQGIATLVGETTFGKGSVQELVPLTKDTSLKITVARWLTPNGVSISNGGLKPNLEVKYATSTSISSSLEKSDTQLNRAIELLSN